jgi:hypothetical protein
MRETGEARADAGASVRQKPLRLWPGVLIAALVLLMRYAIPTLFPSTRLIGALVGVVGGLVVAIWWVFFSRAPRTGGSTAIRDIDPSGHGSSRR